MFDERSGIVELDRAAGKLLEPASKYPLRRGEPFVSDSLISFPLVDKGELAGLFFFSISTDMTDIFHQTTPHGNW